MSDAASTTPHRAHRKPFTFTTNGRLTGPSYYSAAQVCVGIIVVRFYDGKRLLNSTTDPIQPNCTFFNQATFKRLPGHGRKGRTVKLKVVISYSGGTHQGETSWDSVLMELRGAHPVTRSLGASHYACETGIPVESAESTFVVFGARMPNGAWHFRSRRYERWCYRAATGPFVPLPEEGR